MKNKVILLSLVCVLLVGVLLAACAPAPAPKPSPTPAPAPAPAPKPQPIKLVYGNQNPETGWEVSQASKPWLKKVEEATKGQVITEGYYAQSLFKGTDAWEAIKSGQTDIGFCAMGFFPGLASLSEFIMLPFLPLASAELGGDVMWQLYEKYPSLAKQYADVKVLNFIVLAPFFAITKDKQIKTLEDMKGMKMRTLGGPQADAFKALGGSPMFMGINEVYQNVEKGVVDGGFLPWEAIMSFRLYEVVKYYTYMPFSTGLFIIAMNNNKWNSLSPDVQKAIMSVSGRQGSAWWSKVMGDGSYQEGRKIVAEKKTTMIEYTLPPDELAKWTKAAGEPEWDKWIKANEAKGLTDAKAILDDAIKMLKK